MKHRAVITGMGVITPVGNQLNEFWNNLISGNSGIGLLTRFDTSTLSTKVAGEVKNFEPTEWIDKKKAAIWTVFPNLPSLPQNSLFRIPDLILKRSIRNVPGP